MNNYAKSNEDILVGLDMCIAICKHDNSIKFINDIHGRSMG